MKQFIFLLLIVGHFNGFAQPNILWIVCEDISPTLSMYGDSTAKTPNLDALAAESMIYNRAFSTIGVCAPTRSGIITGMYPTAIGTMHMRTGKDMSSWGKREYATTSAATDINGDTVRQYAAVIPENVKCFPEYLRKAGYFCTNNFKTDYQFAAPRSAWDENDAQAHWRNRSEEQPFFSVFNFNESHESQLWKQADSPLTVDPFVVPIPPYFPDNAVVRNDIARHYSNVERMDKAVGKLIQQLKDDGLYDETIIFFYSDHGGPLPRQKREIYDSGLHVPFFVKMPQSATKGKTARMISFVDLAPTVLSLAQVELPAHFHGEAFLGESATAPREYIYAHSDRFDEFTDRRRGIRDDRYLYVYNFFPDLEGYKAVSYRANNLPLMQNMLQLRDAKELDTTAQMWFQTKKSEELYDCYSDPHNLNNLAADPTHAATLSKLRAELFQFMQTYPDLGQLPERQLIDLMWPNGEQPSTAAATAKLEKGKIKLHSTTKGASVSYLLSNSAAVPDLSAKWQLYTSPVAPLDYKYIYFLAERIGYQASPISIFSL